MQPFGKFESPDFERSKMPVSRDSKAIFAILPGSPISVVSIGFRSIADSGGGGGPPTGAGGGGGGAPVILGKSFILSKLLKYVLSKEGMKSEMYKKSGHSYLSFLAVRI